MSKGRVEAFTDGVIAIILTILVLDIKLPDQYSWHVLWDARMQFVTYIVSFFLVAMIWNQHHQMFAVVKQIDSRVMWANILMLFWLSLLPVASSWYGRDVMARPAGILFAVIVIAFNLAFLWLNRCVQLANKKESKIDRRDDFKHRSLWSLIINILAILIVYFFPPFALISTVFNAIIWIVPLKIN